MQIKRLTTANDQAFLALRAEALRLEPFAFLATHSISSREPVRQMLQGKDHGIFAAYNPGLVGIVGFHRSRLPKSCHKCTIWGLYVTPAQRRKGIGRALALDAIRFVEALPGVSQVLVCVSELTPTAKLLCESIGFATWGIEPAGLRVEGMDVATYHMVLGFAAPVGIDKELAVLPL